MEKAIDDLKINIQNSLSITDIDKRINSLESCLDTCNNHIKELDEKNYSFFDLYNVYSYKKQLYEYKNMIDDCIIDSKLKPRW